jgi:hypothetical protein
MTLYPSLIFGSKAGTYLSEIDLAKNMFLTNPSGPNVIKLFLSINYGFP